MHRREYITIFVILNSSLLFNLFHISAGNSIIFGRNNVSIATANTEENFTDINCWNTDEVIQILDARYGINSSEIPEPEQDNCITRVQPSYYHYIEEQCDGTESCEDVQALQTLMHNCDGRNSTYVAVYYTCVKSMVVCVKTAKTETLTCGDDTIIALNKKMTIWLTPKNDSGINILQCKRSQNDSYCPLPVDSDENFKELFTEWEHACNGRRICSIYAKQINPETCDCPDKWACSTEWLKIAYSCTAAPETIFASSALTGHHFDKYLCPYGNLVQIANTRMWKMVENSSCPNPESDWCFVSPDARYMESILDKCDMKQGCGNLIAMSTNLFCNNEEVYSDYVTLYYTCKTTEFLQNCTHVDPEQSLNMQYLELNCTTGSTILIDSEFTTAMRPDPPGHGETCDVANSCFVNVASHLSHIFDAWSNECNGNSTCYVELDELNSETFCSIDMIDGDQKSFWQHLSIFYICQYNQDKRTSIACAGDYFENITCENYSEIHIEYIRMGVSNFSTGTCDLDDRYFDCLFSAPASYEIYVKNRCHGKNTCSHIFAQTKEVFCRNTNVYTDHVIIEYTCKPIVAETLEETCVYPNGSSVDIECSNTSKIYITESGTMYKTPGTEGIDISVLDKNLDIDYCPFADEYNDTCVVSVSDEFGDKFTEWKMACDYTTQCNINVSYVDMSMPCDSCFKWPENSTECPSTNLTISYQCISENPMVYRCTGSYFDDYQLCYYSTVAKIKDAKYGKLDDPQKDSCNPDPQVDRCLEYVHTDYLTDIKNSCDNRQNCYNLKALSSKMYCNGMVTYSDYVAIYYDCIEGDPIPIPTTPQVTMEFSTTFDVTSYEATTVDVTDDLSTATPDSSTTTPVHVGLSSAASHSIVAVVSAVIGAVIVILIVLILAKTRGATKENAGNQYKQSKSKAQTTDATDGHPTSASVEYAHVNKNNKKKKGSKNKEENDKEENCYYNLAADKKDIPMQNIPTEDMEENTYYGGDDINISKPANATNMMENTYYQSDNGKMQEIPNFHMEENTYYGGDDIKISKPANATDMMENTYYQSDNGKIQEIPNSHMEENTYYGEGNSFETSSDQMVDNVYYDGDDFSNGNHGNSYTPDVYYEPQETKYGKTTANVLPVQSSQAKPVLPVKPQVQNKGSKNKLENQQNYAYTYQHFALEGRNRDKQKK